MGKAKSTVRYIAGSFFWGAISKIVDAGIKFLTIPILLNYFGKEYYGLLTLAIATNAYMALLNMGMNTGAVKFFSQWIATGKYDLLHRTAQTNISFYLAISIINSFILVAIGIWGGDVFQITPAEFSTFRDLLFILAAFSIVNWVNFTFNQLLIADERIAFTQQMYSVKSVLGLAAVGVTILFNWSLIQYFVTFLAVNSFVVLPFLYLCKKRNLISSIVPAFYWKEFLVVFKYGLAILAMSLFQFTAVQSRPIILGIFSDQGVGILAEYRVMEVFPLFIISIGGMLVSVFLPKTSKAIQSGDRTSIEKMAYEGTKYTSILVAFLCFPVMLNVQELLSLYVGVEYIHLTQWLFLWVFTLTLSLHNSPVSSLVLATGKTKMLVFSSGIACIVSMIINAILASKYGVGSAVIGYLVYIIIQVLFYYLYFNNRVLSLKSLNVFKSFVIPTGLGFIVFGLVHFLEVETGSFIIQILINSLTWGIIYILMLIMFRVIDIRDIKNNFIRI
ncbi:lipopolysaccharide biosynthesis protein [Natronoflexus pectinivorans]|uniref:O-antigen/teichoic acid export membrane protein n=1 Tax=Natronoflexus pectinivorans TaxID=682526 RepID=A0A4R2GHH5_9BACT|nr:polysaccharide biosynthesis C-terminal domain-containing protein [Natronoflexus pectinivorans]TCO07875.1 O-antigen/teichoic acid export membrane protein [Natronoflexus pectinivorans]